MAHNKGIDISRYQGAPDFAKVKKEVDFVIMQAGYGRYATQKDAQFERSYEQCKKHGIPCGVYWFSYAKTAADAKAEAAACLEVIKGKKFEYPIYFDVEGDALTNKATVSACCKAFCGALEKAGYFAGIYISRSPAQTYLDSECVKNYALWLAEYGSKLNWTGSVGMWQNSSNGRIGGISGSVDTDICYEDYPELIKSGGFNGYTKAPTKYLEKEGFKRGDRGDGVYALKRLLVLADKAGVITAALADDGVFGEGTEKAVNAVLKKLGYKQNGVAGEKLMRKVAKLIEKTL